MRFKLKGDPKSLFRYYSWGSLGVLLICLSSAAMLFSLAYNEKERQRAKTYEGQLKHFFLFHYRPMTEEMWTKSYEAIGVHVAEIAKQLGNADYSMILANPREKCVYSSGVLGSTFECALPPSIEARLKGLNDLLGNREVWEFDTALNKYVHVTPLFVGAVLQGFLYVAISDPYSFLRGSSLVTAGKMFLPVLVAVVLAWFFWLLISRRFILRPYLSSLVEMEKKQALGELAGQVAHDIRSPLLALDMILMDLTEIQEQKRIRARNAVSRIRDIANDLKQKGQGKATLVTPKTPTLSVELIPILVDSLVSEKRIQFRVLSDISIEDVVSPSCYCLFSKVNASEFHRVLSNLINNAVEAMEGRKGIVTVSLALHDDQVRIQIQDSGRGISADLLPKVGQPGMTFGKKDGSGLGVYHAKNTVTSWGGTLEICSQKGLGTTVEILLPKCEAPSWYLPRIELDGYDRVVILDDDESIHEVWKHRFKNYQEQIQLNHFLTAEELQSWHRDQALHPQNILFLFDYELLKQHETGLDLIESLGLAEHAVLVTSRYDEPRIRERCSRLGVRVIPKGLAGFVPLDLTLATQARGLA